MGAFIVVICGLVVQVIPVAGQSKELAPAVNALLGPIRLFLFFGVDAH